MKDDAAIKSLFEALAAWALALAGSHARGVATPFSDLDIVILSDDPARYLRDSSWASEFGIVEREQLEHYGQVRSLRVWYGSGLEIEFGFTTPDWADEPLDPGTKKVIDDGLVVLWEREPLLAPLLKA
jgi:predicted nucleotidyltransferase